MAVYLNTYRTYQVYGGPEEGGWTYECGEPIQSILWSEMDLDEFLERISWEERVELLTKTTHATTKGQPPTPKDTGYGGYTFAPGQSDEFDLSFSTYEEDNSICTCFEDHFAMAYPQERPHYE